MKPSNVDAATIRGLAAAFKLIQRHDWTDTAAQSHAIDFYPHATRVIAGVDGQTGRDATLVQTIASATMALHGTMLDEGQTAETLRANLEASLMADTGFYTGFATCWLLMRRVIGGER